MCFNTRMCVYNQVIVLCYQWRIITVTPPLLTNHRTTDLRQTSSHHPHCQALQQICGDPLSQKRSQLRGTAVAEATGKNRLRRLG